MTSVKDLSGRSLRTRERFDYEIFSKKGVKIPKGKNIGIMSTLIDEEIKLVCKIKRFMTEYELSLLFELDDIETAIVELRVLLEGYQEVHMKLVRELKESYSEAYQNFDRRIAEMTDWLRNAKLEIRQKKEDEKNKVRDRLRAEEKYYRNRIIQEFDIMSEVDSVFLEDLDENISHAQKLLHGYTEIFVKIEELGEEFRSEFGDIYDKFCSKLNTFIIETRKNVQKIKITDLREIEGIKLSKEKEKYDHEKRKKIIYCENLYDNICDRLSNIEARSTHDISNLPDNQLLEMKKYMKTVDSNFNEVLDRITKFSEANPYEFDETRALLENVSKRKNNLKGSLTSFKTNLETEIVARDLSEEKLKNASLLRIKLPIFKGYESLMDVYTFKSEFEKLITPRVQKQLLPDYLKNNYLEGQALKLVKEIDDLDKIWDRLKIAFGNVETLLSNKLREIEGGLPLWKIKTEEKIIQSIITIKNTMIELRSLAIKHNIEQNLFHTSNLARIYNLIGKKRQVAITKKLLDSGKNDQEKWDEIIKFLDNELKLKEQLILFEKCNPKEEITPKYREKVPAKTSYTSDMTQKKCYICGKLDHIPTITNKGKIVINYFSCERFAKMNPKERHEELK